MSFLKDVNNTAEVQEEKDVLGGSRLVDTDVYPGTIEAAFITEATSGALAVNLHIQLESGAKIKETIYFTNKNKETFYSKDGKNYNLPGFNICNAISGFATGKDLTALDEEIRTVKVYDADQKKEVAKDMPCLTSLHNKPVLLGIIRKIENKSKKVGSEYEPTADKREFNTIERVFDPLTRKTSAETRDGSEAVFIDQWLEKNKGKTINAYKEVSGTADTAKRPSSVFGGKK
jgi:hypothetical protein